MTPGLVADLADIGVGDAQLAGLKVARLAELARRGWRVPDGYVVTTAALAVSLGAEVLDELELLVAGTPSGVAELEATATRAREIVENAPVAEELFGAIQGAHARLEQRTGAGSGLRVAVRSSGAAEDGAQASFAGQFDTYLGIQGASAVLEHVRRCWGSLFTARSLEYRRAHARPPATLDLAVGIMALIDARASGVLFTAEPTTADADRMVIEASWGLGEPIVAGRVTPDRWVTDGAGQVLQCSVSRKEVQAVYDGRTGGVVERPMPPELADRPSLTSGEVAVLCERGRRLADEEGCPQDIEWAFDAAGGEPIILQHRPVTTAPPVSEPFDPVAFTLERVWKVT